MLQATLQIFPGVGAPAERRWWARGVRSWSAYADAREPQRELPGLGEPGGLHQLADAATAALVRGDAAWFTQRLPPEAHARIAAAFPDEVVFLDVETTGLSPVYDILTVVGWAIGGRFRASVLDDAEAELREDLARAAVLVTFNGVRFDVPFLRRRFPDLALPPCHVDLRYEAARHGWRGGLKAIEVALGFRRAEEVAGIRGSTAPVLWSRYRGGDLAALETLLRYNHADVESLKLLLDACLDRVAAPLPGPRPSPRFAERPAPLSFVPPDGLVLRPFAGGDRETITVVQLLAEVGAPPPVVVGIDLTGSEARPSGWAVLRGSRAETDRVATDEELVTRTLAARPTVVSIDSPLSLPVGRTRVTDDDPARRIAGITRECERILFRRGVRVYPCLIQSMQRLTERGIRLAARFRAAGVPVIESYPGAAQDILGIPRKRASLEELVRGLRAAGVAFDDPADRPLSHDELDAITSALVGLFFWAGRFEGLGNPEEDWLIVPALGARGLPRGPALVVGMSGPIAAGKTTAARMLQRRGFGYGRFSEVLADELRARGEEPTRESLQRLGHELWVNDGQRGLQKRLLARLPAGATVVDGLRHPEDHAFFAEVGGARYLHLRVDAGREVRRGRLTTGEELDRAEAHPAEAEVGEVGRLAHGALPNYGTLAELEATLLHTLAERGICCPEPLEG